MKPKVRWGGDSSPSIMYCASLEWDWRDEFSSNVPFAAHKDARHQHTESKEPIKFGCSVLCS